MRTPRTRRGGKRQKIQIEQIDVREVLDELGVYYTEEGKNVSRGWIGVQCCWCGDQSNHFGINVRSKTGSCFHCGRKGSILTYTAEILNSFDKALDLLSRFVPREFQSFDTDEEIRAIHVYLPKEATRKITPYHAGYLKHRGFDPFELGNLYNLHFVGPLGPYANRIIVPIVKNFRLVTYTSIDISDETIIRYKHLSKEESIFHAKELLYGQEFTDGNSCVVVEGLMDKFRIGPGCVTTFGASATPEQIRLLSKFKKVVIAYDGDDAGREGSEKLANNLCVFSDVEVLELPEGDDPDKLNKDDVNYIRSRIGK